MFQHNNPIWYEYICCYDPFCFSRQFHTTLINHDVTTHGWMTISAAACFFRRKKKKREDYNESLEGGFSSLVQMRIVSSWFLMRILYFVAVQRDKWDFSVVDTFIFSTSLYKTLRYQKPDTISCNENRGKFNHKSFRCVFVGLMSLSNCKAGISVWKL